MKTANICLTAGGLFIAIILAGFIPGTTQSRGSLLINSFNSKPDSTINKSASGNISMSTNGMMGGGSMMGGGMMGRGMMNGSMMNNGNSNYGTINNQRPTGTENWTAPPSANKLTNTIKDIEKASNEGKNIFDKQCFTCHGYNAKGDGPIANTLNPRPADLTSSKVQDQSDGALYWKISHGNPPMPAFKDAFTEKQRWDLVTFIRSLR